MKESLIAWVNSIEYPNCLLATDITSFKDGVIFCEIVNETILKNQRPDFLTRIKHKQPTYQDSLENIEMALETIRAHKGEIFLPTEIEQLQGQEVIENDNRTVMLLEYLYRLAKSNSRNEEISNHPQLEIIANALSQVTFSNSPKDSSRKPPVDPNSLYLKPVKIPTTNTQKPTWPQLQLNALNMPEAPQTFSFRAKESPKDAQQQQVGSNRSTPLSIDQKVIFPFTSQCSPFPSNSNLNQSPFSISSLAIHQELNNSGVMVTDFLQPGFSPHRTPKIVEVNFTGLAGGSRNLPEQPKSRKASIPESNNSMKEFMQTMHREVNEVDFSPWNSEQLLKGEEFERKSVISVDSELERIPNMISHLHLVNKPQQIRQANVNNSQRSLNSQKPPSTKRNNLKSKSPSPRKGNKEQPVNRKLVKSSSMGNGFGILKGGEKQCVAKNGTKEVSFKVPKKDKKAQIEINPISSEVKSRVCEWLSSIMNFRGSVENLDKRNPKVCRNGVLFADLLNRIGGKHESITGIIREPNSVIEIKANFIKVMNHLKKFEKMNPRYLHAEDLLIKGNSHIFWGLLDDIYYLYHSRISPFDTRFQQKTTQPERVSPSPSINFNSSRRNSIELVNNGNYDSKPSSKLPSRRGSIDSTQNQCISWTLKSKYSSVEQKVPKLNMSGYQTERTSTRHQRTGSGRRGSNSSLRENLTNTKVQDIFPRVTKTTSLSPHRLSRQESYTSLQSRRSSYSNSQRGTPRRSLSASARKSYKSEDLLKMSAVPDSKEENSSRQRLSVEPEESNWTIALENEIFDWFDSLGISSIVIKQSNSLFTDALRNGTLLCQLIEKLKIDKLKTFYEEPKSIDECRCNIYLAFSTLNKQKISMPVFIKGKEEAVIKGNRSIIFGLLQSMKKHSETKKRSLIPSGTSEKKNKTEFSSYTLPYNENEIEMLEKSLLYWLSSLRQLKYNKPKSSVFNDLVNGFRNGLLLCELVSILLKEDYEPRHNKPTVESHCLNNIRKSLESLRKQRKMSQRFLWKEREIYEGNKFVIIGLLEDLHRLYDGLPPKSVQNYFSGGPYLPLMKKAGGLFSNSETMIIQEEEEEENFRYILGGNNEKLLMNDNMSFSQEKSASTGLKENSATNHYDSGVIESGGLELSFSKSTSINYETSKNNSIQRPSSAFSRHSENHEQALRNSHKTNGVNQEYESRVTRRSAKPSPEKTYSQRFEEGSNRALTQSQKSFKTQSFKSNNGHSFYENKELTYNQQLKNWLATLRTGFPIQTIDFDAQQINQFRDGVLLIKILEHLEQKKISGVILKPLNKNEYRTNIQRCLAALSANPKIGVSGSVYEEKLAKGDGKAIREILMAIKIAYCK